MLESIVGRDFLPRGSGMAVNFPSDPELSNFCTAVFMVKNFGLCVLLRRDRDEEATGSAAAQDGGRGTGLRPVPAYAQAPVH